MPPFDLSGLQAPVSGDEPSGPDLEFDAGFSALERAAQGKPEQQFGSTIIPGEDPDWKEIVALSGPLLERTRDLRVLSHLAVARLHLQGLPAFAEVVEAIRALLEAQWDTVHPQLDPEDDNDPTLRANALLRLAHAGTVLKHLRGLPLASSLRAGQFSWRDVALATGEIESDPDAEKPSESTIRSAFQDTDATRLVTLRDAALQAAESATGIGSVFDSRAGYGTGPDFGDLAKLLRQLARTIDRYAILGDTTEAPAEEPAEEAAYAEAGAAPIAGAAPRAGGGVSIASITEVTTRADALRLLDLVSRYYQRFEPSSPLPLMIERVRRLAEKDFIDILRDLAPDGLMQAQNIFGIRDE